MSFTIAFSANGSGALDAIAKPTYCPVGEGADGTMLGFCNCLIIEMSDAVLVDLLR